MILSHAPGHLEPWRNVHQPSQMLLRILCYGSALQGRGNIESHLQVVQKVFLCPDSQTLRSAQLVGCGYHRDLAEIIRCVRALLERRGWAWRACLVTNPVQAPQSITYPQLDGLEEESSLSKAFQDVQKSGQVFCCHCGIKENGKPTVTIRDEVLIDRTLLQRSIGCRICCGRIHQTSFAFGRCWRGASSQDVLASWLLQ